MPTIVSATPITNQSTVSSVSVFNDVAPRRFIADLQEENVFLRLALSKSQADCEEITKAYLARMPEVEAGYQAARQAKELQGEYNCLKGRLAIMEAFVEGEKF